MSLAVIYSVGRIFCVKYFRGISENSICSKSETKSVGRIFLVAYFRESFPNIEEVGNNILDQKMAVNKVVWSLLMSLLKLDFVVGQKYQKFL